MRHFLTSFLLLMLITGGAAVKAQMVEGLTQDAKGRYNYTHTSYAPDVTKEALHERLQPFVINDLNASETYIQWDETRRDSIVTVAFFELDNSPEIKNQVIDCKARLDFTAGAVTLKLMGFNYSAIVNNSAYGRPLHRMNPIPDFAQSYAKLSLEGTLLQLADKMDKAAAGVGLRRASAKTINATRTHKAIGGGHRKTVTTRH